MTPLIFCQCVHRACQWLERRPWLVAQAWIRPGLVSPEMYEAGGLRAVFDRAELYKQEQEYKDMIKSYEGAGNIWSVADQYRCEQMEDLHIEGTTFCDNHSR